MKQTISALVIAIILLGGIGLASARLTNPSASTAVDTSGFMQKASNLSDLVDIATGRKNLLITKHCSFVIENATTTAIDGIEGDAMCVIDATSTIQKVYAVNSRTGDTMTFNLLHGSSRSAASSSSFKVFASNQTNTATTTATLYTSFASSTLNAGTVLRFFTTAASSSQFVVDVYFTEN